MSVMDVEKGPPNFSWVVDGLLAGCGFPDDVVQLDFMVNNNIKYLVSLTQQKPPLHPEQPPHNMTWIHIPMEDFTAPSLAQMLAFTKVVEEARTSKQGVVVHCARGRGRTGTMLAAYLVYREGFEPRAAIDHVRALRPHSIETRDQEEAISLFSAHLKDEASRT